MIDQTIDEKDIYAFTQINYFDFKVDVIVFVDKAAHDKYIEDPEGPGHWHSYPYRMNPLGVRSHEDIELGRLGFVKCNVNVNVVFHEITHMANMIIGTSLMSLDMDAWDEWIARENGRFASKFYNWFYQEGLDDCD